MALNLMDATPPNIVGYHGFGEIRGGIRAQHGWFRGLLPVVERARHPGEHGNPVGRTYYVLPTAVRRVASIVPQQDGAPHRHTYSARVAALERPSTLSR